MKHFFLAAVVALGAATASASALAQAPTTTSTRFPLGASTFVPCALGGAGEEVETTGTAHQVIQVLPPDEFRFRVLQINYQGLGGTGLTSGDRYRAVSATAEIVPTANQNVYTLAQMVQFVGQGPGNNFQIHFLFHVTVNANGEVTASLDELRVECR